MKLTAISLLLTLVLASIAPITNVSAQENTRLTILTTTTIMADVVGNVAGDMADVTSLMGIGQDPHSFEPSPKDIITLDEADVVFINGANFEESLTEIIEETAADRVFNLSNCVLVLPLGEIGLEHDDHNDDAHEDEDEHEDAETDEDHADENHNDDTHAESDIASMCEQHWAELGMTVSHDEGLGHHYELDCGLGHDHADENTDDSDADHAHEDGSCDPHVWQDIDNVMLWVVMARDVLSSLDPANADIYAANAAAYLAELTTLEAELDASYGTIPVENRVLVTNHDVLGYLAHRYEFEVVGTILPSAVGEASAADIIEIIEVIEDSGAPAIFADNTISRDIAEQVANEVGVPIFILYTDSLSVPEDGAGTYIEYMRYNNTLIVAGLTVD